MAITPQHFAFVTKYVLHFVAQILYQVQNIEMERSLEEDNPPLSFVIPEHNKTLGRVQDPRTNGAWLNKLTEWNTKCLS